MLPGVELARRRRVHYHGDGGAAAATAAAGERRRRRGEPGGCGAHPTRGEAAGRRRAVVVGSVEANGYTRMRKVCTLFPGWGRRFRERDGSAASRQHNNQREQQSQLPTEPRPAPSPSVTMLEAPSRKMTHRREMRMTLSKADLCAVCLDEVRERHQRVTRLPCSHKYHSECVLPWLAIQPDCPCCRTLVPSVDSLFVT
uniref:RING-type domain-containing protein n=1 Tax=Leersia perrieri TaxID=77586 RepID=A0A0D9XTL4_9ORYZ